MEFLKSVAAVSGRLVTSVMLSLPSGHIPFRTGLELEQKEKTHGYTCEDFSKTLFFYHPTFIKASFKGELVLC